MTVSTEVSSETYTGNGVTTVFPFRFKILSADDLVVLYRNKNDVQQNLVLNTDYTISGVGSKNGGSITLTKPAPDGWTLYMERYVDIVQDTDIRNQGNFYPEVHEDAFDYLTMIDQQQQLGIDRAVKVPPGSETNPDDLIEELKRDAERAETAREGAEDAASASADSAAQSHNSAVESGAARDEAREYAKQAEGFGDNKYTFPDEAAGIAGTDVGQYFRVPQGSGADLSFIYYRHNEDGTATAVAELIGAAGIKQQFEATKTWIASIFEVLSENDIGGVARNDIPLLWDDNADPSVIMALRSELIEIFAGVSFSTALKVENALGNDPRIPALIDTNKGIPVLWDDSTDPKVIAALRDELLDVFSGVTFNTALKVDEAIGRDSLVSRIYDSSIGVPLLWDGSDDPKVILYLDDDGKVKSVRGFVTDGGTSDSFFGVVGNDYVNQNVRAFLHSVKNNAVTDRNVKILLTGHSWTDYLEIPRAYREMLQPEYGDGGIGYQSFNPTRVPAGMTCVSEGFTKRTIYDAVTADGTGINGRSLYATSAGATVTFTGLSGSHAVIHYQDLAGSFSVKVGDAEPVQVAGGGTNKYKTLTVAVPRSPTAVEVTTTSAGKVNLFGVAMENASGVSVFSMGNAGCHAHDYANRCIQNYPDVVPVVKPDCVLILLGTNEAISNVPPATYKIYLRRLVNAWKNNVEPGTGISIVSCAHTLNTSNSDIQARYPKVERELALELGVGYVDGFNIFPKPPVSSEAKLFANREHLNDNGAKYFAEKVINRLMGV